jgi:hypothetical protein
MIYKKILKNKIMNKKTIESLFCFLFLIGLLSCAELETNDSTKAEEGLIDVVDLSNFLDQQTDGSFYLDNSVNVFDQEKNGTAKVGGAFRDKTGNLRASSEAGTATIGGIDVFEANLRATLPTASAQQADALFGKDVVYAIKQVNKPLVLDTLYIPKKVILHNLIPADLLEDHFYPGRKIEWEADSKNTLGVAIIVKYNPLENSKAIRDIQKQRVTWVKNVSDTGSFTLPADMFASIPQMDFNGNTIVKN